MTVPTNVRSLCAFGMFCAVGGAWLTLVTGVRTLPLRTDIAAASAAQASPMKGAPSHGIEPAAAQTIASDGILAQ